MFKFLFLLFSLPVLFCSQPANVINCFCEANMIYFYNDGEKVEMSNSQIEEINNLFYSAIENSISMPAFGVSIDSLTKEAMKKGMWIEFIFEKTLVINDMPFDSLLIQINENICGFNIIRGNDNIYQGRCFYLDLNGNNLNEVYNYLVSLTENESNTTNDYSTENQENETANVFTKEEKNLINNEDITQNNEKLYKTEQFLIEKIK